MAEGSYHGPRNRLGQMKCSGLPGWKGADLALCIRPPDISRL